MGKTGYFSFGVAALILGGFIAMPPAAHADNGGRFIAAGNEPERGWERREMKKEERREWKEGKERRGDLRERDGRPERREFRDRKNDGRPDRPDFHDRKNDGRRDRPEFRDRNNDGRPDRPEFRDRNNDGRPDPRSDDRGRNWDGHRRGDHRPEPHSYYENGHGRHGGYAGYGRHHAYWNHH